MRNRSIVAAFLLLMFSFCPLHAETIALDVSFGFPEIRYSDLGATVSVPDAPDEYCVNNWPEIPCRTLIETLPFGSRIISVESVPVLESVQTLLAEPARGDGLHLVSSPDIAVPFPVRDQSKAFPENTLVWDYHGGLNPQTFEFDSNLILRIFPIQFLPDNQLRIISHQTIRISYESPSKPLKAAANPQRDEAFVIVTASRFLTDVDPYLAHRQASGTPTGVYDIETILSSYSGVDDSQKLRNFIRDRVELSGTAFVLMLGDADVLPVHRPVQVNDYFGQQTLPTDLYFSDLYNGSGDFINWDADGNGSCGIYPYDLPDMDFYPDVFVSRIPASTSEEIQIALTHAMNYETNSHPDDAWFNRVVFSGVDTFTLKDHGDTSGVPEGEQYAEYLADHIFPDQQVIRLYETDLYPHDAYCFPSTVVDYLSQGAGFAAFHCHGAPDCFWLKGACFDSTHAKSLTNNYMQPLMFGFACSTAAFDNELPDWPYTSQDESMPEHFLFKSPGGTISFVGATRVAFASSFLRSQHMRGSGGVEYGYFLGYKEGLTSPAMMMAFAERYFVQHIGLNDYGDFYTLLQHVHFGDPILSVGGLNPQPQIRDTRWLILGEESPDNQCIVPGNHYNVSIRFVNSGAPANGFRAVLECSDPEITADGIFETSSEIPRFGAAESGFVFGFHVSSAHTQPADAHLKLSIYRGSDVHYQKDYPLHIGSGPYLNYTRFEVHGDTSGNGNVDPGDTIYPAVFVQNIGCETAQNITLELTSSSPYVDECGSPYGNESGDIPSGWASFTSYASVSFHVVETCPDQTVLPFTLTWRAENGGPWVMPLEVTVNDLQGPRLSDTIISSRYIPVGDELRIQTEAFDVSGTSYVQALITAEADNTVTTVSLSDDGIAPDLTAGDGIYSGSYVPQQTSDFHIDLKAQDGIGNIRLLSQYLYFSSIPFEPADVLIVHQSTIEEAGTRIADAVDRSGSTFFLWRQIVRGTPDLETLLSLRYRTVIWTFGYSGGPDAEVREIMAAYVSAGGSLLVCGWDTARALQREDGVEFMTTVLGIEFRGNNAGLYDIEGISGDVIGDAIAFSLRKKSQEDLELTADKISPIDTAISALTYTENKELSAGVYMDHGPGRTMFLPYGLESIKQDSGRNDLIEKVLMYFKQRPTRGYFELNLNQNHFIPGDEFDLWMEIGNAEPEPLQAEIILALTVEGMYWFWPSWTEYHAGMQFENRTINPDSTHSETLLNFMWPEGAGEMDGLAFWVAFLDPDDRSLLTDLKQINFSYGY